MIIKKLPFLVFVLFYSSVIFGQCFNSTKYPSNDIIASGYNGQTITIATNQFAGQYCVVQDLIPGRSYTFTSSGPDFITHRVVGGISTTPPTGQGVSPYSFTATTHNAAFHINLISPSCGSQTSNRTTTIVCTNCPSEPAKVGINKTFPNASLDINGEIQLADSGRPPQAGMIRWNNSTSDFEGFDGTQWRSFTKTHSAWGTQPTEFGNPDLNIIANDGMAEDLFGNAVCVRGDYAIIGALDTDIGSNGGQGCAYIFKKNGNSWTQQAKLIASDGSIADHFGFSVSIDGDYAIIGVPDDAIGSNSSQGSAYIFTRSGNTWTQQAKITASDGAANDYFGQTVSINGDYAVVGSHSDDIGSNIDQGSAYVFLRTGTSWTQQAKLIASDGATGDSFGQGVCINGSYAAIGATGDDIGSNNNQGSVYIFLRTGTSWAQQTKLLASDGGSNKAFGYSVSLDGTTVLVSSSGDQIGSNVGQGSAYVFVRNGTSWSQQAKLIAADGAANDFFGISVSLSGDFVVIGADFDDIGTHSNQGSAYVFQRNGTNWSQQVKLIDPQGLGGESLGQAVSISGNTIFLGSESDNIGTNNDQGSCLIFYRK